VNLKRATVAGQDRILAFFHEINERKKAESELIDSQNTLRDLTAHLQTVREEERTHLAREVHDVLGQQITGLKMDVTWLNKKITGKGKDVEERFKDMLALADDMVKTVRKISSELRPGILDDLGLIPALEWQSSEFEKRTGIKCYFSSHNTLPDITKLNATGIFRIYQETLTNVARHAQATTVDAIVTCEQGDITLTISDNGKGLNPAELKAKKTLGIVGMKERAAMMKGNLTVQPGVSGGTTVVLSVPAHNKTDT
jgi:signal transduction histidine kinase